MRKEIRATLVLIEFNPNLYAQRYNTDFHFAPLDKFPFIIVYWFDKGLNIVFIASIFHSKRNPDEFEL
ncbi:hypothetical protein IDJ76_00850 [Mucilaginibacter sp. ZB1P21]|uniref:ParE-like toxin of type II ParDE toxin-antitoxin system n=1 Tax=Mucilaginibacter glaciei TaxID=2772109 RepID=A0A926S0E1_9SPHI|nr:hypothetical protein [Mucilaginibacter glaciei]